MNGLARRNLVTVGALALLLAAAGLYEGISPTLLVVVLVAVIGHGVIVIRPVLRRLRASEERLADAERQLHASERRYQSIVENAIEGIFQTTPEGRYLTANPALARIYGYASPVELIAGLTDITRQLYVEPNRRHDFVRALQECGVVSDFESRIFRKEGSMIWIAENARAVRDANGALLYYEGTVIDISERKRAEEELRRSESELRRHRSHLEEMVQERTIRLSRLNDRLEREIAERRHAESELRLRDRAIDSISEGIVMTDPRKEGNPYVYANPGFERLTGYSRDEILGQSGRFLDGPGTDPAAVEKIGNALREERECAVELLNYRKDGSPFWNLLSITPVRDVAGELESFIAIHVDITERKRIEALKDDLVATVSHELRTPLASLRGFTELMLQREFPRDKQREFLGVVHGEALRLTRLVNDFLDLQRIESGHVGYRFAEVDLGDTLRTAVRLFALHSSRHTLRLDLSGDLPLVHADPDQIHRVLANLLSNAVKFSPQGGEVILGARQESDVVRAWVADQGIGIEPDAIEGLFQKFHRLENAQAHGIGGTGLGLALVRRIIEAHGGRVGVTSRPGVGSEFSFTVPVAAATVTLTSCT